MLTKEELIKIHDFIALKYDVFDTEMVIIKHKIYDTIESLEDGECTTLA